MADPSNADILKRIDDLDRVLSLELRALRAEVGLQIAQLRDDVRSLWGEHLGHTHPPES